MNTTTQVPFLNLAPSHGEIAGDVLDDVAALLESGMFTNGPAVRAFESAFAEFCGVSHCVGVANGLDALRLALIGAGLEPGDEVIVPAMTFVAGAAAVRHCGARPVLVESIGPDDLNLDPEDVERHIGPHTRAVLATHWLGYACDLRSLERLFDFYDFAEREGIVLYGGGQSELGPGRGQIQLLAAIFHPDGSNDVAPVGWDQPAFPRTGLPVSPMVPATQATSTTRAVLRPARAVRRRLRPVIGGGSELR